MTTRLSLRDYQRALAERLAGAQSGARSGARLALAAGGEHWLVALDEAGELLPVPAITRVPLTRAWFRGVVNVRGNLHSVVDLSAFLGGAPATVGEASRLLLLAERFGMRSALLVDATLGLREPGELEREPLHAEATPWMRARYRDAEGRAWNELDLQQLAAHDAFCSVAAA